MGKKQERLWPLLLSILIILLIGAAVAFGLVQGMRSVRKETAGPTIHVWHDQSGDLWVETARYRWNISSGEHISYSAGGLWQDWAPDAAQKDTRVVDMLFLSPTLPGTITRSQILFTLPDRAIVYLERSAGGAAEVVELAFRASDSIVRVTHGWRGAVVPPEVLQASAHLSKLEGQFVQEMMRGLSAKDREHLVANYAHLLRFDPAREQVNATLFQQAESERIGAVHSACSDAGDAQESTGADPWLRRTAELPVHDPCQFLGFYLPGRILGSEYLILASRNPKEIFQAAENQRALNLDSPDLDAAYIMRTPHYSFRAAKTGPEPGEDVAFVARVANSGKGPTGRFDYQWSIDGIPGTIQSHPGLEPQETITVSLDWVWQTGLHTVTIQLDPENTIAEISEWNNSVQDRTGALAVGFWVEQSVYDYFNAHQVERGLGSMSWEDWAQRQLATMNSMLAAAVYPLSPQGILDRVRLDKVVIVPDGALPPCAPNQPDAQDLTVDLQWGFPAELVGIDNGHGCKSLDTYFDFPLAQDVDFSLLHELSHARYLVDIGGFDVHVGRVLLSEGIGRSSTEFTVDRDVEQDDGFPIPVYLAIDGELVVCQSKDGSSFSQCERGAEGSTRRSHPRGTAIHLAVVRLQDGQGNLIQGSAALPVTGEVLYRNPYPDDLMAGGVIYGEHSAYAWNRIAGQRPCCGNANAPDNIGEYLNDIPQQNVIEVRGSNGQPIPDARLEIYRARPLLVWYGEVYLDEPDAVHFTDSVGQVHLSSDLFGGGAGIIHTYGHSNAVVLLKISTAGWDEYRFLDVTEANIAYWSGNREVGIYPFIVEEP